MNLGPRGPLESLMLSNAVDGMSITTFGKIEQKPMESPKISTLPYIRTWPSSIDSLNNVATSFHLMSKSVEGVLDEKYPLYKERQKLALERENRIKERAEQARADKFGDRLTLLPKLAKIKEKVF